MKKTVILGWLIFVQLFAFSQTDNYRIAYGIDGISYAFFNFNGTLTFENGETIGDFYEYAELGHCLVKFDESGNVLWVKELEGNGGGAGLAVDSNNDVYITASFRDELILDNETTIENDGYEEAFLAKYDQNGELLWFKRPEGPQLSYGVDVALDENGHVLITGRFRVGDLTMDDLTPLQYLGAPDVGNENIYMDDIFIIQLDKEDGSANWIQGIQGNYFKTVRSITAASDGSSFLSGRDHYQTSITKFTSTGEMEWQRTSNGPPGDHYIEDLTLDNNSNIYATGQFDHQTGFGGTTGYHNLSDSDGKDLFLVKYDSSGEGLWSVQASIENSESVLGMGVGIDGDILNNIYLIGRLTSSIEFPPLEEQVLEYQIPWGVSFLVKLNQDGEGICQQALEGFHGEGVVDISVNDLGITYLIGEGGSSFLIESRNADCSLNWTHDIVREVYSDPVSVDVLNESHSVNIYPNPTSLGVTLEFEKPTEVVKVIVTNMLGEQISEQRYGPTNFIQLDLPNSHGVFYIEIISKSGRTSVHKLIKQ